MANTIKSDEELDKLRDESYLSVVKKGYKVFKGCTLPKSFEDIERDIDEMEVYEDDVWITSFPKSGTTWTQEMVWCLCNNVDLEAAKVDLMIRFYFVEIFSLQTNMLYDINFPPNSIHELKYAKRPRFIKTHLPWNVLPKQIRTFEKRPKIIHVMRNPKDACVSYYHHQRILDCFKGDFESFWQLFLGNKVFWSPFTSNVLSYWSKRNEQNVFLLKFEDMRQDLMKVMKETSEFLNVSPSNEQMTKLYHHLSFDSLKKNDAVNFNGMVQHFKSKNLVVDGEGKFMRKGVVGDHKTLMSPDQEALFDKKIGGVLKEAGLEL